MADNQPAAVDEAPPPPSAYKLANGEQVVEANGALNEDTPLWQVLHWISFIVKANMDNLQTQSIGSFNEMLSLTEKDCQAIATD